jgi:putative hydrolase of the HAD superfamily
MIKAVFFDLYHTLIHYHPPREEALSQSLARRGINAAPAYLRRAIIAGDEYFYRENARKSMSQRTKAETKAVWQEYEAIVLKNAGIEPAPELIEVILGDMQRIAFERVLFSDVLPAFDALSGRGLALGLVSNVDKDIQPLLEKLGLMSYLKVVLTSRDVGATKPEPRIFTEAVRQAGVGARDSLYVGDQYEIDVLGARRAGLEGLLLDRYGSSPGIPAIEKIKSLEELSGRIR